MSPRADGPWAHLRLANGVTACVAALGLVGAASAAEGELLLALVLGALAVPGDMLDGALARKLGQSSAFGARLDSLADLLAFGVLPASLVLGSGWAWAGLLYVIAAAWRLAWYEDVGLTEVPHGDGVRRYFSGVPVPYVASVVLVVAALGSALDGPTWMTGAALLLGPALMLGPLRFRKNGPLYLVMAVLLPSAVGAALWVG